MYSQKWQVISGRMPRLRRRYIVRNTRRVLPRLLASLVCLFVGFAILLDLRLLDGHRCLDMPLLDRSRVFAWPTSAWVMLRTDELTLHL